MGLAGQLFELPRMTITVWHGRWGIWRNGDLCFDGTSSRGFWSQNDIPKDSRIKFHAFSPNWGLNFFDKKMTPFFVEGQKKTLGYRIEFVFCWGSWVPWTLCFDCFDLPGIGLLEHSLALLVSGHSLKLSATLPCFSFTPPKFNSEFAPEKWWLEDDPSYWEGNGSGTQLVLGMVHTI